MRVPITGNHELDALTVRAAIRLRAVGLWARSTSTAATAALRQRQHLLRQRYRRARRRAVDSKAGRWLAGLRP